MRKKESHDVSRGYSADVMVARSATYKIPALNFLHSMTHVVTKKLYAEIQ